MDNTYGTSRAYTILNCVNRNEIHCLGYAAERVTQVLPLGVESSHSRVDHFEIDIDKSLATFLNRSARNLVIVISS